MLGNFGKQRPAGVVLKGETLRWELALNMLTVLITGATSGLGFETALAMARLGHKVILGARNKVKAEKSVNDILAVSPEALVEILLFDLADLKSVADASIQLKGSISELDVLVNNAGVMAFPVRQETNDGFENQFGTNHLGHFALTAQVLELLRAAKAPKVVTLSSFMHRFGQIHFEDLNWQNSYSPWGAYSQSKLANLLFTMELGRRSRAKFPQLVSLAAHPGYSSTNLITAGPMMGSDHKSLTSSLTGLVAQSAAKGAAPTVEAILTSAPTGTFFGPSGFLQLRGKPKKVMPSVKVYDGELASRLWAESEKLTAINFDF